jgi:phosphoglycolate phosphatase
VALLIFDLDGTLIDSRLDLVHATNNTRAHLGLGPIEPELIYSYVGDGAPVLVRRALGPDATEHDVSKALGFFLEYYRHHALDYTTLYPGVRESLEGLHSAGQQLAILTNKPVRITHRILEGLGIAPLFFEAYGGNSFARKKPDPIGIDTLRAATKAESKNTWMVGDSHVDVRTARNAGVFAVGVTWGFQPESLREHPPDLLIDHMAQLLDYFIQVR